MEWMERFLLGGLIVSVFSVVGDVLRPKGFAGLFGGSSLRRVLATLGLTLFTEGKEYAALEARSMIVGAGAFLVYAIACVYFIAKKHRRTAPTTIAMLLVWFVCAFGCRSVLLK